MFVFIKLPAGSNYLHSLNQEVINNTFPILPDLNLIVHPNTHPSMKEAETKSIQQVLDAWLQQIKMTSGLLDSLSDDQLSLAIAPRRNTGKYLLGHLIAVHDALLPLLNLGEKLYPELEEIFIHQPDNDAVVKPSIPFLREAWQKVHLELNSKLAAFQTEEWLSRHQAVSEADFLLAPHRNKLNVILNRTCHLSYHAGQLILLSGNL